MSVDFMEAGQHLKTLLQTQLASDLSAVKHLPFSLTSLTRDSFKPSPHLAKWTTRIHALLHSKDSGARWAGLCLAYKTSILSQNLMIETAQSYLGVALPLLSRNEPIPTLKAAIRLLRTIFTTALDITEFQRQVLTPNVLKFTMAVIALAEKHEDPDLKVLCMYTLTRLIILYPSAHRAPSAALSAFSLRSLNGSALSPINTKLLDAISSLYSVLHLTGGKVGAVNLWRKSTEETLSFGWESLFFLRRTFPDEGQAIRRQTINEEPQIYIPLNLDRLRCTIAILCNLMSTVVQRPIQVPVGHLVRFCTKILSCTTHGQVEGFIDPSVRSMEIAIVPTIWSLGCNLLSCLAIRLGPILDAHTTNLASILNFQLEQNPTSQCRLSFLSALDALLRNCHYLDSPFLPTILAKNVVPSIAAILSTTSGNTPGGTAPPSGKNNKGKKRLRNYEGDEIFNVSREVVCTTDEEGKVLLASIDVTSHLFRNPNLSSSMQSIIARIIISALIVLPRMPSALLSANPSLMYQVKEKIQKFGVSIGSGTSSVMSKSLPFVIEAALEGSNIPAQKEVGLLLHPRVPPLVRSMPHVESLSLFKAEESQDEADALSTLGLTYIHPNQPRIVQDISMTDVSVTTTPRDNYPTQSFLDSTLPLLEPTEQTSVIQTNPPPTQTKPSNMSESAGSPIGFHSTVADSKMVSDNTGGPSTIVSKPVLFSKEDEQDGDEEMPLINIDSDSEAEDTD